MIQLWNTLSNIGIKDHLNIFEQRKIRIINQTNLHVALSCLGIILFYIAIDYTDFIWFSILTILVSSIPVLFNFFHKYTLAKASFVLMFFLIELLIAFILGEQSYMEFCILALPVSAILLFTEDSFKQNIALCSIGIAGFLCCEFFYSFYSPIIALPNPLAYKIITGFALSLTLFQNVRFFKLDLLHIEKLNRTQNKILHHKRILIEEQNQALRQINGKLLLEIEGKKKAEKRLLAANEELQQFASVASHDMKEPLRTISSFSSLLSRQIPKDKNAQEYLFFIKDAAERMTNLLHDLILFARAGKNTDSVRPVNLNDVMLTVQNNLHTTIKQKNAIIKYDNLPMVEGHFTPFIQLFQNLIANGIKYQKSHHQAIVTIHCEDLKDQVQIRIADNGIGMKTEYLKQIFSPFTRLHTQQEFKGSGIGLATCMKIVQRYGGEIWVESEFGIGSTFYIRLPKKQEMGKEELRMKNEELTVHS